MDTGFRRYDEKGIVVSKYQFSIGMRFTCHIAAGGADQLNLAIASQSAECGLSPGR